MSKIDSLDQEILKGSSRLFSSKKKEFNRTEYMIQNMEYNEAYISLSKHTDDKKKFLENLKKEYKNYRDNWVNVLKNTKILKILRTIRKFHHLYQLI